ncbi:MAG: hypothetical protein WB557_05040, partial [Solirubrobacteraceae bacterium]
MVVDDGVVAVVDVVVPWVVDAVPAAAAGAADTAATAANAATVAVNRPASTPSMVREVNHVAESRNLRCIT